jgi:hypothetical protein
LIKIGPKIMEAIEAFMFKVTVPLLYGEPDKKIDLVGTGTLFVVSERYFLVTAAHIFHECKPENFAFPRNPSGDPDLQTIGRSELYIPADKNADLFDFAVLELLEPKTIDAVKSGWETLTPEYVGRPSGGGVFVLCGYPSAVAKRDIDRIGGCIVTSYSTRLDTIPKNAKQPVDEGLDLFFKYDREATKHDGETVETPRLEGTSGASVWEYRELPNGTLWDPRKTLRIVGVQSSALHGQFFRAKAWAGVVEIFRQIDSKLAESFVL